MEAHWIDKSQQYSSSPLGLIGFLPGIFSRGKSIVMQISFVMLIFLFVFGPNFRGQQSLRGQTASGGAPTPVEESQGYSANQIDHDKL